MDVDGAGLSYKPPPQRPGSRSNLQSAHPNNNTNMKPAPDSPTVHKQRSKSSLGFNHSTTNNGNQVLQSSSTSPSSSDSDDSGEDLDPNHSDALYAYNGGPSSSAAQTVAASKQCTQKLQTLLSDNQDRVHAAGRLGQELLGQKRKIEELREELEEVLSYQEDPSGDGTLEESKFRIQELRGKIDGEVELMESKTAEILLELGASSTPVQSIPMSPSKQTNAFSFLSKEHSSPAGMGTPARSSNLNPNTSIGNVSSSSSSGMLGSIPGQPTPRQSDRRARNNAARQSEGDQEFREEVHKGLLNEVRRISALLVERDAEIALLRKKIGETEKEVATWKPRALALIESEDSLKQENWDLDVARQELEEKLESTSSALRRAEADKNKFSRDLSKAREVNDAQRVENEDMNAELEKLRTQRDTDGALARKEQATMKRDNSDLQAQLKTIKDRLQDRSNISRSVSNSGVIMESPEQEGIENEDPRFGDIGNRRKLGLSDPASPSADASTFSDEVSHSASPLGSRLVGNREVQDLRGKLALAQKKAGKELADKKRQREKNEELRKLLAKAGVDAPAESEESSDEDDETDWNEEPRTSASAKSLAKMRGRIPKSSTRPSFASRLGLGRRRGASQEDVEDEDEEFDGEEPELGDSNLDLAAADHSTGSSQGIDPAFASTTPPPTGTRKSGRGRRSAVRSQGDVGRGSPLARGSVTAEDEDDDYNSAEDKVSLDGNSSLGHDQVRSKRPASSIIEAGALGDELSGLAGPDDSATRAPLSNHLLEEEETFGNSEGTQRMSDGPEMAEMATTTEPQPSVDLVGPALLERDQLHSAALSAKDEAHSKALSLKEQDHAASLLARDQSHAKVLSDQENRHINSMTDKQKAHAAQLMDKDTVHADNLAEREKAHSLALSQKDATHSSAISLLKENHSKAISSLEDQHEQALSSRDLIAASALATALAERTKIHEAGLAEARSRHTKSLAEQVDLGKSELSKLEAQHAALLAEKDRAHMSELDRRDTSHATNLAQTLAEKEEEHESYIGDIEATNKDYVSRVEAVFKQSITERDALIKSSGEEIERLRSELDSLKAQLQTSQHELGSSQSAHAFKTQELASTKAQLVAAAAAVAAAEEREREREREEIRKQEEAAEADEFEDATSDIHLHPSGLRVSSDGAQPLTREVSTSGSEADSPKTPQDESVPEVGIKKVVLADLKDTSCQTDDALWSSYQQQQQRRMFDSAHADPETAITRPPSALTDATRTEANPEREGMLAQGGNGIVILGGHRNSVQRPRDSISTFGGNRDGGSARAESPAPTMYTVGAMLPGHNAGRRFSTDSNYSHAGMDKSAPTPEVIPDRTKPPVMALPPPPSMPPPPGLPVKRSATSSAPPPARSTSPPPAALVQRAARASGGHLQVPGDRPSSRLSGASAPPSAYNGPANSSLRGTGAASIISARRQRTISTDTTSGMTASEAASLGRRKSVSSARSIKGKQRMASSAASFASDVTSLASERMSVSSSHASDLIAEDGTRRVGGANADSMDPEVMRSIMTSMIGSFLWKYTRKSMGRAGHSDKRHRRYFWLHPYTNMVYWQVDDPGADEVKSGISKNAVFDEVRVVEDNNHNPPGLYHLSIILKTKDRDMKVTAPNRETHESWITALDYLVARRPNQTNKMMATAALGQTEEGDETFTPATTRRQRSRTTDTNKSGGSKLRMLSPARSFSKLGLKSSETLNEDSNGLDSTPRPRGSSISAGSVLSTSRSKRRDTAAHEYLAMQESQANSSVPQSPRKSSVRSSSSSMLAPPVTSQRPRASELFGFSSGLEGDDSWGDATPNRNSNKAATWNSDPRLKSAEQMLEEDGKDGYEGLDNVRACCDGKHDVGSLAHKHHHHQKTAPRIHKRMSSGGSSLKLKNQLVSAANREFGLGGSSSQSMRARPSSPAPQLSLNLSANDGALPPRAASALGNYADSNSNDANGKSRPESGFGSVFATYENHASGGNSYSDRVDRIRRSRQSTGGSK